MPVFPPSNRFSTCSRMPSLPLGCERTFTDTASGVLSERKGSDEALAYVRTGDVLVVWQLDRLGRSLTYLIEVITRLNERGIGFKSITEQIDTTTSEGNLIFPVFGALAEFERDLIRERTQAVLVAVRARGRMGGPVKEGRYCCQDGDGVVGPSLPRRTRDTRHVARRSLSIACAHLRGYGGAGPFFPPRIVGGSPRAIAAQGAYGKGFSSHVLLSFALTPPCRTCAAGMPGARLPHEKTPGRRAAGL